MFVAPDPIRSNEWMNWLDEPVVIIENQSDLAIVGVNGSAKARLDDGFPFQVVGNKLVCATTSLDKDLRHALKHGTRLAVIERHPKTNNLILIWGGRFNTQFCIRMTPLDQNASLFSNIVIGNSLQLTRAETGVLLMIFADLSAAQIAQRLGLSLETVRTHRKRIYAKLGVNGRASVLTLFARAFEV